MKKIALDTNAYSALARGQETVATYVKSSVDIAIPLPVLGELYFGIYDGKNTTSNYENLEKFLSSSRVTVLKTDQETAKLFGELATELKKIGKPIQQNDIWIAALCKQHGYSLITNDQGLKNIIGLHTISF